MTSQLKDELPEQEKLQMKNYILTKLNTELLDLLDKDDIQVNLTPIQKRAEMEWLENYISHLKFEEEMKKIMESI